MFKGEFNMFHIDKTKMECISTCDLYSNISEKKRTTMANIISQSEMRTPKKGFTFGN